MDDLDRIAAAASSASGRGDRKARRRKPRLPGVWLLWLIAFVLLGIALINWLRPDLVEGLLGAEIPLIQILGWLFGLLVVFWIIYAAVKAAIRDSR